MAKKSSSSNVSLCISTKLSVKVNRYYVYLHEYEDPVMFPCLSIGPNGVRSSVFLFINNIHNFDKATKRKLRKALFMYGRRDLAAESVPMKKVSMRLVRSQLEAMRDRGYTDNELREQDSWMR